MKRFLFLDRDGVLNRRLPNDYVKSAEELEIFPGVPEALASLRPHFERILVISNQQGIGKGLMTAADLEGIHRLMARQLDAAGGQIDDFVYCPDRVEKKDNCRKPSAAMALEARKRYPEIRFENTWMIGDTAGDIEFARNLGMHAIMIGEENLPPELESYHQGRYPGLIDFARAFLAEVDKNHNTRA